MDEYVAYNAWNLEKQNYDKAVADLAELNKTYDALVEEYDIAKYDFNRPTNGREEYNAAKAVYEEVKVRYDDAVAKFGQYTQAIADGDANLTGLKEAYDTAKSEREKQATFI